MSVKTNASEERYTFFVEWHDMQADLIRRYQLTYFLRDSTVEMYDMKNRRPFLKRCEYPSINRDKLHIGAIVTVYARQLKIIEYGDEFTAHALSALKERGLLVIKPDAYNHTGKIMMALEKQGFVISNLKMVKLSADQVRGFMPDASEADVKFMTTDVVIAMELIGDKLVEKLNLLAGADSPDQARAENPRSLRATYGTDQVKNAVHVSRDLEAAKREIAFFFGKPMPGTALFNNCTLCVVRPHAMSKAGEIVNEILYQGFEISAMQQYNLDMAAATEFLEVYEGVLPEFTDVVAEMCSGPVLVMEIRQENAVVSFREIVGPHDPEIAKHLRPTTLRAKYGENRVQNGVHCTDLPEDGLLEVEYFFSILANRERLN